MKRDLLVEREREDFSSRGIVFTGETEKRTLGAERGW